MAMTTRTKTRILLGGSAARLFGREHTYELSTGDAREAVKAIDVNHPGFAKYLTDAKMRGLEFVIFRDRKNIGENELKMGGAKEIRIVPVIAGSKRAGLLQTILGVVLIAMSPFTHGATLAPGIALAAGGVIQMLSPQQGGLKQSANPENQPSYAFGSARNTTASGNPVPICIGERRWGGAIISAAIYAEDQA
ncbi:tail assembly protein [Pseudomonas piscis]|uniref:Tail assembly protein n=1 Tax=Pseudomonas piscis TaxID=2614538 RepID=A0A7X1PNS1_9PSED|nr:tail assembly protein [Pseudomonas piscis]MQA55626.1 tail assembly protein [Pseudomonas piscis]